MTSKVERAGEQGGPGRSYQGRSAAKQTPSPVQDERVRRRLSPEDRQSQILAAAARLIVEQGYLPLSLEELAKRIGISKALIYRYYPTQIDLFDALLDILFEDLDIGRLSELSDDADVDQAMTACAERYFDHVGQFGPALYIVSNDLYSAGKLNPRRLVGRDRLMAKLARRLRDHFGLSARDSLATLRLFAAMVEEGGAIALRDPSRREVARRTLVMLIRGALAGLSKFKSQA